MAKENSSVKERQDDRVQTPRQYRVLVHNDDFTTMDFVVEMLMRVFYKPEEQAIALMLDVHVNGVAVAGVYGYDVAMSKVRKATDMAREEGFPLRLTCEPEE